MVGIYELIKGVEVQGIIGKELNQVSSITDKSLDVQKGALFCCISGLTSDGHLYAKDAVKNGATAVLCERTLDLPKGVTQIIVENVRKEIGFVASNFYCNPSNSLKIIGVTGTNGKTTITHMIKHILDSAGVSTGIIGTNGIMYLKEHIKNNFTTPDPIEFQKTLADMRDAGITHVVMEVSAHALDLHRINGTMTDIAVFTNLSQDHLDYFKNMENYKQAKLKLFTPTMCRMAVVNADDEVGQELIKKIKVPCVSYGINKPSDVRGDNYIPTAKDCSFDFNLFQNKLHVKLSMAGRFNMSNALAAAATCKLLKLKDMDIADGLYSFEPVRGRFNCIPLANGSTAIIDYAHSPDGLENILKTARELTDRKIISVFGCGGNRDTLKRPIMGSISAKNADFTIVTSDNPRHEEPELIARAIEKGVKDAGSDCVVEVDRKKAIRLAYSISKEGDIIVISGKGAEDYLDIKGKKIYYSDYDEVEALKKSAQNPYNFANDKIKMDESSNNNDK